VTLKPILSVEIATEITLAEADAAINTALTIARRYHKPMSWT
jgi:hypothetical protein